VPEREGESRILEPIKDAAADRSASDRRSDDGPARGIRNRIALTAAQPEIGEEAGDVRENLERQMRMEREQPKAQIERKVNFSLPRSVQRKDAATRSGPFRMTRMIRDGERQRNCVS
jgi:hypothetical protein